MGAPTRRAVALQRALGLASGGERRRGRSLQTLLPTMIVVGVLGVIAQQHLVARHYQSELLRTHAAEHAASASAWLANSARHALEHDERLPLAQALATAASTADLALVVDAGERVIASSDDSLVGRSLSKTPLADARPMVDAVRTSGEPDTLALESARTVVAAHPLERLVSESAAAAVDGRIAVFGASVVAHQHELERVTLATALTSGALVLGIAGLFWLVIDRRLLRPLKRLLSPSAVARPASERLAGSWTPLAELERIAATIDSLATVTDEHERTRASEARLARVVETSRNEIFVVDAGSLRIVDANREARRRSGYTHEELVGRPIWELLAGRGREDVEALVGPLRETAPSPRTLEGLRQRKDGSTYPVRSHIEYMDSETPPVFVAISQDISDERRRDERARLHERAIEAVGAGVIISDATVARCPIVYVNDALCQMTGYLAEELLGRSPSVLQGEDQRQPGTLAIADAQRRGASVQTQLDCVRRDGSRFVIRLTLSPVRDADGVLTHYIGIHEDITRELETEAQLLEAQRIDAVGQLAGGIAHDFNNLLDIVMSNLELLARGITDPRRIERIDEAYGAAEMGARLTRRLLAFARRGGLEPQLVDVNERVRGTLALLRSSVGEPITLDAELAEDLWHTRVDPSEVENAAVNLVVNARDALASGGRIRIVTANARIGADAKDPESPAAKDPDAPAPGEYVRLSVVDDGCGMSAEVRSRAFEPFFTTKEPGRGTGLGLASVYGFARQSGGTVTIASATGCGTTVSVYLPRHRCEGEVTELERPAAASEAPCGARVLVVEDNDKVREVTLLRLETLGHVALEARDALEATLILGRGERVDAVLSDIVMAGGMSGYDLVRWIRERGLGYPILLVSGFAEPTTADRVLGAERPRILAKPYSLAQLREALAELLGPAATDTR